MFVYIRQSPSLKSCIFVIGFQKVTQCPYIGSGLITSGPELHGYFRTYDKRYTLYVHYIVIYLHLYTVFSLKC